MRYQRRPPLAMSASLLLCLAGCTGWPVEGRKDAHGSDSTVTETGRSDTSDSDTSQPDSETPETGDSGAGDSDRDSGETGDEDTDTSDTSDTMDSGDSDELSGADAKLIGEEEGDYAGAAVAALGDVNGDGRADLLVAAPERVPNAVYLALGPVVGRVPLESAEGRLTLEVDGVGIPDWSVLFGSPFAGAGDNDGDDLPDLILSTPYAGTETAGIVWLFPGYWSGSIELTEATGTLVGVEDDSLAGTAVAGPGDVNGDGWEDFLVGAANVAVAGAVSEEGDCATEEGDETPFGEGAGAAYLVLGPVSGEHSLSDAQARITGEDASDGAGSSVARVGDLDGDGYSDLFIGSLGNCEGGYEAGAAYVVLGPLSGELALADADTKLIGERIVDRAGEVLSSAGDVDADGYPDLLVSAPKKDYSTEGLNGKVYLVLGGVREDMNLGDADASFIGTDGSYTGASLSSTADIDADGFDDFLIGARYSSTSAYHAGGAYVIYGPISGSHNLDDSTPIFNGPTAGDIAGWAVAGLGDTDADGSPDILIGAPGDDDGGDSAGAAWLFGGASL